MNCKYCPLNIDSKFFRPKMMAKIPLHFRNVFLCSNECSLMKENGEVKEKENICCKDLWVLTFLGQKEKFAEENAISTMDYLVEKGFAELLCNLFENASYATRRQLWQRMTSKYANRLYLFNALFEKQSLAPIEEEEAAESYFPYQNSVLFPSLAYQY